MTAPATLADLEAGSIPEPTTGCWFWLTGAKSFSGHRRVSVGGRAVGIHRIAWSLANGRAVPDGMLVRHLCAMPMCVNPDHLAIGTPMENAADREKHHRWMLSIGMNPHATKRRVCGYWGGPA